MRAERRSGIPNEAIAVLAIVILVLVSWWAFTKQVPWGGGTTYEVAFENAQNLRVGSPVRIAGVEVGEVRQLEPLPAAEGRATALATLELDDEGLPLKEDAQFKLRPRMFLEGNLFVEVQPGSPTAREVEPGHTFSTAHSTNSVQLDRVLTGSLQSDARHWLQVLLAELGTGLEDGGGAEALREFFRSSPGAFRETARVSEALLGERPGDLSGLVRNVGDVAAALSENEAALGEAVRNLRIVTGSLAAEDAALERAVAELPGALEASGPAFGSLNAAFPQLRSFAREALPGVESAPGALRAATPFARQLRLLARRPELRGLVSDLRPTVPALARLTRRTIPFLEEARALSSCFNEVIIPWSEDEVDGGPDYPHPPVGPVFKETAYGLVGIAGEARSQDANGQHFRVLGGAGLNTVAVRSPTGEPLGAGVTPFPIEGAMPSIDSSAKTPFRPDQPCEAQELPDLRASLGPPPEQAPLNPAAVPRDGEAARILRSATGALERLAEAAELAEAGERAAAAELAEDGFRRLRRFSAGRPNGTVTSPDGRSTPSGDGTSGRRSGGDEDR